MQGYKEPIKSEVPVSTHENQCALGANRTTRLRVVRLQPTAIYSRSFQIWCALQGRDPKDLNPIAHPKVNDEFLPWLDTLRAEFNKLNPSIQEWETRFTRCIDWEIRFQDYMTERLNVKVI